MKFKITTKTPTFIGKGDFLSSSLDFIVKDNIFYFLDITKLQDRLISNSNYKKLIKELTNIILKKEGNIYKFFEINKLNFKDFVKYSYQIYFPDKESKLKKINVPIQNNNGFYIPGSTLKGLIRTALIFKYIKDNNYLNKLKETIKEFKNKTYIGDDIFRVNSKDINTDALKFIQVSDSNMINLKNLKIFQFERITYNNKIFPQLFLGIPENIDFHFEINILNGYNKANIPQYWKDAFKNENLIIESLQNYILILLKQEREIIEKINNNIKRGLSIFYNNLVLEQDYLMKEYKNETLTRIGFGKTYYFNSIGYFLDEEEREKLKIGVYKGHFLKIFPTSRWVIRNGNQILTPGFCKLKYIQK